MQLQESNKVNIWAQPKAVELRFLLLTLEERFGIDQLSVDCPEVKHRQALRLGHKHIDGLGAYIFTYGQTRECYGLQLHYPVMSDGNMLPFEPIEELSLEKLVSLLAMHFELYAHD